MWLSMCAMRNPFTHLQPCHLAFIHNQSTPEYLHVKCLSNSCAFHINSHMQVMAILFIFDFDDGAFQGFFNQHQREYLESVEIVCSPRENREMAWMVGLSIVGTPLATILPLVLYDPRWQINAGTDPGAVMAAMQQGVFGWSFCSGPDCYARVDPTQTCVFFVCLVVFGTVGVVVTLFTGINERVWRNPKSLAFWVVSLVATISLTVACSYVTWFAPYTAGMPPPSPPSVSSTPAIDSAMAAPAA